MQIKKIDIDKIPEERKDKVCADLMKSYMHKLHRAISPNMITNKLYESYNDETKQTIEKRLKEYEAKAEKELQQFRVQAEILTKCLNQYGNSLKYKPGDWVYHDKYHAGEIKCARIQKAPKIVYSVKFISKTKKAVYRDIAEEQLTISEAGKTLFGKFEYEKEEN